MDERRLDNAVEVGYTRGTPFPKIARTGQVILCDMTRIRKLQRKGVDGTWHSDAYAVETRNGQVTLRYSLAWEYLGGRYNRMIRERGLSLEQLEQVLTGDSLRWLPIETLETDDEEIIQALDSECHVPRPVTVSTSRRADWHTQTEAITLEARIVGGRLRLSAPLTGLIRVRGDRIYLEDGRQLQRLRQAQPKLLWLPLRCLSRSVDKMNITGQFGA